MGKAFGVESVRLLEHQCACSNSLGCKAVVHLVRGEHSQRGVTVLVIVPLEECLAMATGVLNAAEATFKIRSDWSWPV